MWLFIGVYVKSETGTCNCTFILDISFYILTPHIMCDTIHPK